MLYLSVIETFYPFFADCRVGAKERMTPRSSLKNCGELVQPPATASFGLLDLFLGGSSSDISNTVNTSIRTPEAAWDFLTVKEFVNLRCVSKAYRARLEENFEYLYCRDGKDYTVPYPGFPGLLRHGDETQEKKDDGINANGNAVAFNDHNRAGLYPHQLASLRAMHQMEKSSILGDVPFGALRGGVLGDAPGLGKTITTLAVISSTAGRRPVNPPEFWDTTRTNEGWRDFRTNPMARTEILKCLKPIRNKLTSQQLNEVSPPFDDNHPDPEKRFLTMRSFEQYLKRLLRGDKTRSDYKRWPIVTCAEWELVRQNLLELRIGMDKRNRKLVSSQRGQRLLWERKLIRSSATLLVVPDALFEHWFQQIQEHLYLPMFADNDDDAFMESRGEEERNRIYRSKQIARGVVYLDGLGDLADVTLGEKTLENTRDLKEKVLSADQLSGYLIVIVTFSRCRKEVRSGRADNNDEKKNNKRRNANAKGNTNESKRRRRNCAHALPQSTESLNVHRSPLLKLRWLRLMVDEGHQLETDNDLADFIHQVAAERRWVVSGTPVTGNEDNTDYNSIALDQLQRILYFLRHPKYGISKSEDVVEAWETEVKKPFLSRQSRKNLLSVLKEIMVMHRKEDLKLPEPIFRQIEREVDIPREVEAEITANATNHSSTGNPYVMIPYALEGYLQTPQFQSLVDDAQANYVVEAMRKARENFKNLCSNTNSSSKLDRRPIKGVVYSSSNKDLLSVADSILRKLYPENVAELYENSLIGDMSAELERFRHGNKMYRTCPICKSENGTIVSQCDKDLMEVVSIQTGQRFLIEPERVLRTKNVPIVRLGGEPMKNYSVNRKFWAVNDKLVVDIRESHPLLPKRESPLVWKEWGAKKCRKLAKRDDYIGLDWYFGPLPLNHSLDTSGPVEMEVVLKKWQKCGAFHSRSRWYRGPKFLDEPASKRKEDVFLLCLDADLAHGLDLSFVTHIFLLEAINDAALLEQVTSRAHRLGATGPVTIETINVFYKCSEGFQQKLLSSLSSNETGNGENSNKKRKNKNALSLIQGNQNRKASLNKIVCHHCYRQFDSYPLAEEHERTLCPRNPDNAFVVDKYHLSSVYKEIRPPLPMVSSSIEATIYHQTT